MFRVGIYIRKSTDQEDSQMLSLQKQRDACDGILRSIGEHTVVRTWEESVSAKRSGKRPGFREMLGMIKRGEIDTIVCWKLSRLARNPLDQAYIETYLFEDGKIRLIASQDGFFRPTDNVHLIRIHFGESTQYSRNLGKDASEGMLTKVRGGQPVRTSKGYDFDKWKNLIPNHEAPAVREVFRLKRLGKTLREISESVLRSHGFGKLGEPYPTSTIHSIIENPLYYGAIKYLGEIFDGSFTPLISYSEWKEANETNISTQSHARVSELDFARGLVRNKETGNALSPYLQKGIIYFRAHPRDGYRVNIALSRIIEYFDKHIERYSIPREYESYIIEGLRDFFMDETSRIGDSRTALVSEGTKIDQKLANLLDMRMGGELDKDEYLKIKETLQTRKFEVSDEIAKLDAIDSDLLRKSEESFELLVDLAGTWQRASIVRKGNIIRMICTELFIDHEKALHLAERELFREVRNLHDSIWLSLSGEIRTNERCRRAFRDFFRVLLSGGSIGILT